jgi:hypothetical protein
LFTGYPQGRLDRFLTAIAAREPLPIDYSSENRQKDDQRLNAHQRKTIGERR